MAKKNIYENEFKTSSNEERKDLFEKRIDNFKSTKKEIIYEGKDNANYDVFKTRNNQKSNGANRYFIDKSDGTRIGVYKVKNNSQSYSPFKNSELVYSLSRDRNNPINRIENGKRIMIWKEQGIKESK